MPSYVPNYVPNYVNVSSTSTIAGITQEMLDQQIARMREQEISYGEDVEALTYRPDSYDGIPDVNPLRAYANPPIQDEGYDGNLLWRTAEGVISTIDDLERDHAINIVNRFYCDHSVDQNVIRNIVTMIETKDRDGLWEKNKVDKKKAGRGKRIEYSF
jgi:hypothetical protein